MTSAHAGGSAFSVATAIFAHGHALFRLDAGGAIRRRLNHVSWPASACPGCHTLAVFTATGADWFTLAVFFFVTQFASAHVRREAISVLLARLLAVWHTDALLRHPAWRTSAYIWPGAISTQTSLVAAGIAAIGIEITLVAVATIQNRDPSAFLITENWKRVHKLIDESTLIADFCLNF